MMMTKDGPWSVEIKTVEASERSLRIAAHAPRPGLSLLAQELTGAVAWKKAERRAGLRRLWPARSRSRGLRRCVPGHLP